MLKKLIILTFILFLLPSCHVNLNDKNVCPQDITPTLRVYNNDIYSDENHSKLYEISNNGNIIEEFKLKGIHRFDGNEYTNVYFSDDKMIKPNILYKLIYNDDVYFIYNIKMANNIHYRMCREETKYKINSCNANGYNITIDSNCAIPADQADEYFESHIKPKLK